MFEQYRSRFDSYTPQQRAEIGKRAAVGLLGLILGLFIGWVIWPLDWRDARLENLTPELQARYLSAVADAYVATQDSGTALARLAEFSDPEQALTNAIRYYQTTDIPNSAIRQVNLRALASATGAAEAVSQALHTDATLAPTSPTVREPAVGWLRWLLVLVAAMLLIVAGGWIGIQLMRNRMTATRSVSSKPTRMEHSPEFDPQWEPRASESQRLSAWQIPDEDKDLEEEEEEGEEEEIPPPRSAKTAVIDATPVRPGLHTPPPPVVLEFELSPEKEQARDFDDVGWENDSSYDDDSYDEEPIDEDSYEDVPLDEEPYTPPLAAESLQDKEEQEDEEQEDEEREDGQGEEDRSTDETVFSPPVRPTPADEEAEPLRSAPTHQEGEDADPAPAATPAEPPPIPPIIPPGESAQDRARRTSKKRGAAGGDAAGPGSFQGKFNSFWRKDADQHSEDFVAEYRAHYHGDIPDYDESFIITPTDDESKLFGACGMGINADLDPRAISNDEVRVLDVWFYDRDDSRSHNQLIVSNGIDVEALAEQFPSSGTITGNPLVAEPGTTFRLTGKNHYVICRIEEVIYRQRGEPPIPFASVKVHLSVHRQHK